MKLALLGATGSIGASTLKVLRAHRERFDLVAISAATQVDALVDIAVEFAPRYAAIADPARYTALRDALAARAPATMAMAGPEAIVELAGSTEVDAVMAAIVGAAGFRAALRAAQTGKRLLLANKEALVVGGALVTAAARLSGAQLLPVDSEHNAIFQCLPSSGSLQGVEKLWLTASGGPFRTRSAASMREVTPAQAVLHPNWSMGPKISVDSATLMNKGLEVIEAHFLFGIEADRIAVLVHPQSVVHSLVEYVDGSFLAQLGAPDMCTPIAHALGWPDRLAVPVQRLNLLSMGQLSFEAPDRQRFPALDLAWSALKAGGAAPVVLNAANEVAVAAFLNGRLRFDAIPVLINAALSSLPLGSLPDADAVLACDVHTRRYAEHWLVTTAASSWIP
jgi:1-deoxy-D-xylulose-5-phosphate reductoisomerase